MVEGGRLSGFPALNSPNTLFVSYLATAELNSLSILGIPLPEYVLDLYAEFRNLTNGIPLPDGNSLAGAVAYFGGNRLDLVEKQAMRELAQRGAPFSEEEKVALLDYCERDVLALEQLLNFMLPHLDGERSLLRGQSMLAVTAVELAGIPIDEVTHEQLKRFWLSFFTSIHPPGFQTHSPRHGVLNCFVNVS